MIAIYDVKTGNAYLNAARVRELRAKTGAGPNVPIIEMHVRRKLSLKAHQTRYSWVITLRLCKSERFKNDWGPEGSPKRCILFAMIAG